MGHTTVPEHIDFESKTHWARVSRDGLLRVYSWLSPSMTSYALDPRTRTTTATDVTPNDGTHEGELLALMASMPIFAAAVDRADPEKRWHVDADAGFQRWRGVQPESEIHWALVQCGFEDAADSIVAYCQTQAWDFLPWQA